MIQKLIKIRFAVPAIGFVLIGLVYRSTLAPTVTAIDSGELAAVQSLPGIAHPTGYPLFTLLGYGFLRIPIFDSPVYQLNWLCLLWCLIGLVLFYKTALIISGGFKPDPEGQRSGNSGYSMRILFSALTGTFFLAFCRTFWIQSTSVEVYSLHIILILLIMFFACRACSSSVFQWKMWVWAVIALALAFSNHMSVLMMIPALLYLYILDMKRSRNRTRQTIINMILFLAVLTAIYLYLPLRASQRPPMNWGNPQTLSNFWRHITGKQYQVWMFSSFQTAFRNLSRFIINLPSELTWPGLLLAISGLIISFIKYRKQAVFLVLLFVSTVLHAVQYDIHDLDAYFLLAYITAGFWICLAVYQCLHFFHSKRAGTVLCAACFLAGITLSYFSHQRTIKQSDVFVFEDYTKQALSSLPKDALLLTYQWDCLISPACYFQHVENFRKDVAVIDRELLRRSWYYDQLETLFPAIMSRVQPETRAFLKSLKPFECGESYNARRLEFHFQQVITRLIETHAEKYSVFIAPELVQNEGAGRGLILPEGTYLIPDVFFYRVVDSETYREATPPLSQIRFPACKTYYTELIRQFVINMFLSRAKYEMLYKKHDKAQKFIQMARSVASEKQDSDTLLPDQQMRYK